MVMVYGFSTLAAGVQYFLNDFDSIFVPGASFIGSTDDVAINSTGNNQLITVDGSVYGFEGGISSGDQPNDSGLNILVHAGGSVASGGVFSAIKFQGTNSLVNNAGTLSGLYGIVMNGGGTGTTNLINSGRIQAGIGIYRLDVAGTEKVILTNTGEIISTGGLSYLEQTPFAVDDTIINSGLMSGIIDFGNGNNTYDGRGGRIVGTIISGSGNDTFLVGSKVENIAGGTNTDLLDFRSTSGLNIALDGAFANTGTAAGDFYLEIENVFGSSTGADKISGTNVANLLRGNGGNDTLYGRGAVDTLIGDAGNDTLLGGLGFDILTGGAGADIFRFDAVAEKGDIITAFDSADFMAFKKSAFGNLALGTLAATAFHSNTTGSAHDASDRFIYETDSDRLWYDADGTGGIARVMMADFSNNFALTNLDIRIV